MEQVKVAMVCKLMPYYRLGIFQELSAVHKGYEFTFFGDTKVQGGIKNIPYSFTTTEKNDRIRWIKTKNTFYKPERLLWQTGILKLIFNSPFKVFVFEGAIAHYPIWIFALLCRIKGKKVLFWTHGNRGLDKGIKKFFKKLLFKRLGNGLFLYGHYQRDNMIADGYDPNRLHVVYNSLQPEKQLETLKQFEFQKSKANVSKLFTNSNEFTLIFIGRLVPHKGVMDILKAMKSLKDDGIHSNCIFIGEGSEKIKMTAYCNENNLLDQVYFAGELYEEEKIAVFFSVSDLMISPGNVGLNCIHSLGYGVPVLTHNEFKKQNPEVEAIIEGETGIFYDYGNFSDMVKKLTYWILNHGKSHKTKEQCLTVIKETYNPVNQAKCMINGLNKTVYES